MTPNMGLPERVLRIILGVLLLGLYGALPAPWRYITMIGLLPLGTGITGYRPVYHALRWRDSAGGAGGRTP
jgi:hypothetical protein